MSDSEPDPTSDIIYRTSALVGSNPFYPDFVPPEANIDAFKKVLQRVEQSIEQHTDVQVAAYLRASYRNRHLYQDEWEALLGAGRKQFSNARQLFRGLNTRSELNH
jgi:hypothetical protein